MPFSSSSFSSPWKVWQARRGIGIFSEEDESDFGFHRLERRRRRKEGGKTDSDGWIDREDGRGKEAFTRGRGTGKGKRPPEIRSPIPDFPQIPNIKAEKGEGKERRWKRDYPSLKQVRKSVLPAPLRSLSRSDSPEIAAEFLPHFVYRTAVVISTPAPDLCLRAFLPPPWQLCQKFGSVSVGAPLLVLAPQRNAIKTALFFLTSPQLLSRTKTKKEQKYTAGGSVLLCPCRTFRTVGTEKSPPSQ